MWGSEGLEESLSGREPRLHGGQEMPRNEAGTRSHRVTHTGKKYPWHRDVKKTKLKSGVVKNFTQGHQTNTG